MVSPETGLTLLKGTGIAGLFIEAVGLFVYVNERVAGYDISLGFWLTIIGFVMLAVFLVMWKKAKRRVLG